MVYLMSNRVPQSLCRLQIFKRETPYSRFGLVDCSYYMMAPKPRITLEDRGKIVALSEEGYTQRVIAARVGCTQARVSGILKKKMVYGNVKDAKIPGRKRKTSQKEDRIVVRKSKADLI